MGIPMLDLDGRVALVTGAGAPGGIGMAAARVLSQMGAEVAVAATSDRVHERAQELGGTARGYVADLTDESQARGLVASVLAHHGRIDILVNNAGMVSVGTEAESGRLADLSMTTWQAGLRRNLDSVFLTTREVLPGMTGRGWGRIVSVASVTGPANVARSPSSAIISFLRPVRWRGSCRRAI